MAASESLSNRREPRGEAGEPEQSRGIAPSAPDRAGGEHDVGHSPNVVWQRTSLTREERWELLGHSGATVWFTGLPAAGKSTIANAVEERLVSERRHAFLLDGDNLRHGLNADLGFDELARTENVRRTAHVASLLAESGTVALVSLVSPYAQDRQAAASLHRTKDLRFMEVFVDAPLALCEKRDPKGLYARARSGELAGMTGVGAPYERPHDPHLVLRSGEETVEAAVERVIRALDEQVPPIPVPGRGRDRSDLAQASWAS